MRIGELLVEQRKLRPSDLSRAIADKPRDRRLGSFLISKGLVDFDDAARALAEQKGVPCALAKHLAGRDPKAAQLIPAELGRAAFALPIGRSSKGTVIVCVRDPAPALLAALRQAVRADVTMVVAPQMRLEHLLREAYGEAPSEEFDVEFTTGVTSTPEVVRAASPPLADMDALDADSVRLALTDLDDVRVDKDPTQSGQFLATGTPRPTPLPPGVQPAKPISLAAMQAGLEQATSRETATDLVIAYVATRWQASVVLAVRDKTAVGYRGHGIAKPESIAVSLVTPSTVQHACETRFVTTQQPQGVAQEALSRALGRPKAVHAAPILVGSQPVAVIAVGDLLDREADAAAAAADLALVAEKLAAAYRRIAAR